MIEPPSRAAPPSLNADELRRVVIVLCATEVISWGVLFYAFPVLAPTISRDRGWSLSSLIAIFSGAQVLAAVVGLAVGRHLDRHGPRTVMTLGSILAVLSLVGVALAPDLLWFAAAWALTGTAMSATLYPPAFTAITHWAGPERRVRALTAVTLVAGFASTIFAPLTAVLATHTSWTATYLFLCIPLAATIPLHWIGLSGPWIPARHPARTHVRHPRIGPHDPVLRSPAFWLLTASLTAAGIAIYAVVVNLVPLLGEKGISTTAAAVALGIGGAGQVGGRLLYAPLLAKLSPPARTTAVLPAAAATTAALALAPGRLWLLCGLSVVAGAGRGVFTLIQATAVSDRWGHESYGARSSILAACTTTATAAAPWGGAILATLTHSYGNAFLVLGGVAAAAAFAATLEGTSRRPAHAGKG